MPRLPLILLPVLLALLPPSATAQVVSDTTRPGVGVRLRFAERLNPLRIPGAAMMPHRGELGQAEVLRQLEAGLPEELDRARTARQSTRLLQRLYGADTAVSRMVGVEPLVRPQVDRGLFGLATSAVDLVIDGELELEISTDRFQNLRCTPFQLQDPTSGCRPRFTAPRIDNQLQLQVRGLIGQRVYLDVDLNTRSEYTNASTIRAYYQGLEDEVLQRVEVGTVVFRPPPSRFLTTGIPINNFGVSVAAEYGPLTVQALMATQKGSVVAERTYQMGTTTVEPQDRLVRDLDYEAGRFYWVVDPRTLPGFPSVDALTLGGLELPANVRPEEVRVYRYRSAAGNVGTNPNLGGITALARNGEGNAPQQVGPLRWELLVEGEHYWIDPSGLWFVLTARLDPNDFLAVSYVTTDGTTVGTFPAVDNPAANDELLLVVEPNRGPEAGTFHHAMRNVYRVAGSDLDRSSLKVAALLNRSERPEGDVSTWLSLFGLARPSDQAIFDTDNRLFPRQRDPGASLTIRDNFIFFPNLRPFADPVAIVDPVARNDSLYRTPEYLLLTEGPPARFQLRLEYLASGGADRGTLSLNALQIREETEQLVVDGRRLVRGIDYSIGYENGTVTFLDPEGLFGDRVVTIRARFEQRGLFAVAPTSIFGLTARYQLGDFGGINLIGLYQSEATAFRRPPLGFEASASLIGGVSTDLRFDMPGVSRMLDRLVSGPMSARSRLEVDAELAFSRPDPNRSGQAYLEEFENDQSVLIPLFENNWQYSSLPRSALGLEQYGFGAGFDSTDAVQLVWQNLVPNARGGIRELRPQDIDTNIVIRGGNVSGVETVMYMTFHADTAGGMVAFNNSSAWTLPRRDFRPRWRSMVTPLSTTGRDLTRNEFLEFWVFESSDRPIRDNGMRLVVDLGSVSEDALALAPETFTVTGNDTVWTGRQYAGAGVLDTERSPSGVYNPTTDDIGIHGDRPEVLTPGGLTEAVQTCRRVLGAAVELFPWGDLGARCTAGNGVLDTEDLDGDLLLDARGNSEDVFRYIVDLDDPKYRVRTGVQSVDPDDSSRVSGWTLYRIPLREVDRTIGQPNLRLIKHLRFTFITPPDNGEPDPVIRFALARMRLLGAPWIARSARPIAGVNGSSAQPFGSVTVTSVSTESIELGYESPPGLGNTINEVGGGGIEGIGVQVNEKSLRTIVRDLRPGSRAEAYHRFSSGAQNLLAYRTLRVWNRGRGEGWDDDRLRAFIKIGTDDENFYWFEAPANTVQWQPEMVVELERWRELRAVVEGRVLRGEPPSGAAECGGDPDAWVACGNGYLVHIKDPAIKPPNLAAVQEVATGILYPGVDGPSITETELWTGDIRLDEPITEVGMAMAASARLIAGDVGVVGLSYTAQDGNFRQIGVAPSYRDTRTLQGNTSLQLGRFLPQSMQLVIPFTLGFTGTKVEPELIAGSDVRGADLTGLRRPSSSALNFQINAARAANDGSWLVRTLVNPTRLAANWSTADATTEYAESDSRSWGMSLSWNKVLGAWGPSLGLGGVTGRLPGWLARSETGRALANARLNLIPGQIRFQSDLSRTDGRSLAFTVPIERIEDTILIPTQHINHLWRNSSGLNWSPLGMVAMSANWASTRDLRHYADSTSLGRLVGQSRRSLLGMDVGTERDRNVTTSLVLSPVLASWLRPRISTSSNFTLSRSLVARNPVRVDGDTAGAYILPQTLNNSRTNDLGLTLDPALLARRVFGDSSGVTRFLSRLRPVDVGWGRTYTSTFDLAAFDPGFGYHLATGGLDDFLEQEGQRAIGAGEIRNRRATATIDLPIGLAADIRYGTTESDRYQRNSAGRFALTTTEQVDWPDASMRWSRSFRSGPLSQLRLNGSIRSRSAVTTIAAVDEGMPPALTSNESTNYRPSVSFYFRNNLTLQGDVTMDRGEMINNGNRTERNSDRYNLSINWSVPMPFAGPQSRKRLDISTVASDFSARDCLLQAGSAECLPISDIHRTELSASFQTDVVGELVTGALALQYVLNDFRHLDRRNSNFTVSLSMRMPLSSLRGF